MSKNSTPPKNRLVALEAAAAEITTASVSIHILRVGNRQLTMGTFRQLPTRELIDPVKVELKGVVWGWVNYLCDHSGEHRQFVVQFGESLCRCGQRRDTIDDRARSDSPEPLKEIVARFRNAFHALTIQMALDGQLELPNRAYDIHIPKLTFTGVGESGSPVCELEIPHIQRSDLSVACSSSAPSVRGDTEEERLAALKRWQEWRDRSLADLRESLAQMGFKDRDLDWIKARMREHEQAFLDYRSRWNALIERLWEAPQLFIAT
jgi:hypothetical protein